jgi:hypothetical protein
MWSKKLCTIFPLDGFGDIRTIPNVRSLVLLDTTSNIMAHFQLIRRNRSTVCAGPVLCNSVKYMTIHLFFIYPHIPLHI